VAYQAMLPLLTQLTLGTMPANVYTVRKGLLTARDMLDVFSPVYTNNTNGVDLWGIVRKSLDDGYTLVGNFQDLDHSHVSYTEKDLETRRNATLDWKESFVALEAKYDVVNFVSGPELMMYTHLNESSFYWKYVKMSMRPKGSAEAHTALQYLLFTQINTSLAYYDFVYPYISVINDSIHTIFHDYRKMLRTMSDEEVALGDMLVSTTNTTIVATFALINDARSRLGNINDEVTAYDFYMQDGKTSKAAAMKSEIDSDWEAFKTWSTMENFRQKLVDLQNSLPFHHTNIAIR